MRWGYPWRGLLVALTLSILGHVWVGLIWRAPVVPQALLSDGPDSTSVVTPSVFKVQLISAESGKIANAKRPVSDAPSPARLESSNPQPEVADQAEGLQIGIFVPSAKLDSPLVPMSAPDTSQLRGLSFSGLPIRLRLLVTATGQVAEVFILQAAPQDAEALAHIQAMFMDTAYIPGQMAGKPVAAQVDMELLLN
jgi:hypothetical protein